MVKGLEINDNFEYNREYLRNKIIFLYINLWKSTNKKYYMAIKINDENINKFKDIFKKKRIFINSEETEFINASRTGFTEYQVKEIYVIVLEKI